MQYLHKEISCAIFAQVRTFFCQFARFAQDSLPNAQYMCKIVLLSPMHNICTRLYFSPQCARPSHHLYTQHHHPAGHKISYYSNRQVKLHTIRRKNQFRCDFFLIIKNLIERNKGSCLYDQKYRPFRVRFLYAGFLLHIDLKHISSQ